MLAASKVLLAATLALAAAGKDWKPEYKTCRKLDFGNLTVISQPPETERAWNVFAADLDGDGVDDVMSASLGDNTVGWYKSDGGSPPTFEKKIITDDAIGAYMVTAADMDDDGDLDVLSASLGDSTIAWYMNDGDGGFMKYVISDEAFSARSVAAGDLNGDGILDAASGSSETTMGNETDGKLAWYKSDGGSPPTWETYVIADPPGQRDVVIADLDGDGDMDIGGCSRLDHTVAFYENYDGEGNFIKHVASNETLSAYGITACDLDLDGIDDMIAASPQLHEVAWYKLEDDGSFTRYVIGEGALGAFRVACGDVDGDGDYDVFSADNQGGTISFYENKCTTPKKVWSESEDGDEWEEKPSCRRNQKVPKFEAHIITSILDTPRSVALGDLDGDSDLDVLSASSGDEKVAWYENECKKYKSSED